MKIVAWIIAIFIIICTSLLAGILLRLALTSSHTAPTQPRTDSIADNMQKTPLVHYQVGDRLQPSHTPAPSIYHEIDWAALAPSDWDPMAPFKEIDLSQMEDNDPRAAVALSKAKAYWNSAPINPKMHGVSIKIPGFVVSLERTGEALKEFLLVPYFGGCIHVPPPPANQIIHVHSKQTVKNIRTMDAVWISGVLAVSHSNTAMGTAGYRLTATSVEPYQASGSGQ